MFSCVQPMILPVSSVDILEAEQMFLQSPLLVILAAHLEGPSRLFYIITKSNNMEVKLVASSNLRCR